MSRTVYCIPIILHAAWIMAAGPAFAADQSSTRAGEDRWVPSVALVVGFSTQKHKGAVASETGVIVPGQGFVPLGVIFPGFDDELRPPNDSQQFMNTLEVGGSVELMTPALFGSGGPRVFISAEILHASVQKKSIAREGGPTGLAAPEDRPQFTDEAILGQGQATLSDSDNIQYGVSLGISVPMEIADWQISVKPSIRYLHRKLEFSGVVLDAFRPFPGAPGQVTREVELFAQKDRDLDALGPGLEIEVHIGRIKSLASSIYVSGGAYRVMSDRKVSFSAVGGDSLGSQFSYRGLFNANIDRWLYRANVGFRVSWLGSD